MKPVKPQIKHRLSRRIGAACLALGLAAFQIFWCCCALVTVHAKTANSANTETHSQQSDGHHDEDGTPQQPSCHSHAKSDDSHSQAEHSKSCDHDCQVSKKTFAGDPPLITDGLFDFPPISIVDLPAIFPLPVLHAFKWPSSNHGPPIYFRTLRLLV